MCILVCLYLSLVFRGSWRCQQSSQLPKGIVTHSPAMGWWEGLGFLTWKLIQWSQTDTGSAYGGNSNGTEYLPLKSVMVNDGTRKKIWVPAMHNYLGNSHYSFLLLVQESICFLKNLSKMSWRVETSFVFLILLHRHTLHTCNYSVCRMNKSVNEGIVDMSMAWEFP